MRSPATDKPLRYLGGYDHGTGSGTAVTEKYDHRSLARLRLHTERLRDIRDTLQSQILMGQISLLDGQRLLMRYVEAEQVRLSEKIYEPGDLATSGHDRSVWRDYGMLAARYPRG